VLGIDLGFGIWNLSFGLNHSNKRELPSRSAFFSVGEEKVTMTTGAEIDPRNLLLFNSLPFHLSDIDLSQVHHPLSRSS
jgi:hypothetical protein